MTYAIVSLRDTYNLIYINVETFEQHFVSMNENDWDTHCSFSALHLSLSPNNQYLAISTDKNSIIVYKINSSERVRIFVGHNCGEYGKPRIAWDTSSQYLYCNSDGEHWIYIYSLFTEKVVSRLTGHNGIVKDVKCHPINRQIVSGSFDHSVIVWGHK